jgi:DNA-binding transcriptional regulator YiaG
MRAKKSPIIRYRKSERMSQEQFGELLKPAVDKSTVSRWERFGVPPNRVLEVAKATGIDKVLLAPKLFKGMEAAE